METGGTLKSGQLEEDLLRKDLERDYLERCRCKELNGWCHTQGQELQRVMDLTEGTKEGNF